MSEASPLPWGLGCVTPLGKGVPRAKRLVLRLVVQRVPCTGTPSWWAYGLEEAQWALACWGLGTWASLDLVVRVGRCSGREKPAALEACLGVALGKDRSTGLWVRQSAVW